MANTFYKETHWCQVDHICKDHIGVRHCWQIAFKLEDWEKAYETAEKDPDAVKVMLVP